MKGKKIKSILAKAVVMIFAAITALPMNAVVKANAATTTSGTTSQVQTLSTQITPQLTDGNKRIVAYFPEWGVYAGHNGYAISNIPWGEVTHINYAFATIKSGQVAIFDDWAAEGMTFGEPQGSPYTGNYGQIKKFKQQYPQTRVNISVGGWSQSAGFHDVAATAASRKIFADSAVKFIRTYGFDGVDIDWEYPTFKRDPDTVDNPNDQGTPKADATEKQTFTLLLQDLRAALTQAGKEDNKYYELTAAVPAGKDKIDQTEPDKYAQYLDFINVMTYDMRGAWDNVTGLQSALYANPKDPASDLIKNNYNVDAAMKIYESYGIAKNKLIAGAPYYSRGWTGVKNDGPIKELPGLYASATGGAHGIWDGGRAAGCNPYYQLTQMEKDSSFVKYRDPVSQAPYLYSASKGEMYTYEDDVSLGAKVNYVNSNDYGGIIFWDISGDSPSKGSTLTDIIYNGFKGNLKLPLYNVAPFAANVSASTVSPEGNYTLTAKVPAYSNATTLRILEGSTVIAEQAVSGINASTVTKDLRFKAAGTYSYSTQLVNAYGTTVGNSISVTVQPSTLATPTGGVLLPWITTDSTVNKGSYNISMGVQANNKADTLNLYENDKIVYTQKLDGVAETSFVKNFTAKADGYYKYRVELTNAAGGKAVGATIQVEVTQLSTVEIATDKPVVPQLSTNNWSGLASYSVTLNTYWGNNGTTAKLYENGVLIDQRRLVDATPSAQLVTYNLSNKTNGTYTYYLELSNSKGVSTSAPLSITVTQGKAAPVDPTLTAPTAGSISVDNASNTGTYNVTATVPVQNTATNYTIYEGTTAVKSGTVTQNSAAVQTFSYAVSNRATGSYNYTLVLTNSVGSATSSQITVTVTNSSGGNPTVQAWAPSVAYKVGDVVSYNGKTYKCIQPHTSLVGWEPSNVAALWTLVG